MMKLSSCELERSDSSVDLNCYCPSPPSPYSHADSLFFGDHCPSSPMVCAISTSSSERSVSPVSAASATNFCRPGFLKRCRSDDFDAEGFDFDGDELPIHGRRKRCKVMESCTNSLKKSPTESSDDSEGYGCFVSSPARSPSGSENGEYGSEKDCDWGLVSPSRSVSSADVQLGIADSGGSAFPKLVDCEEEQDRKMVKTPRKRFKYMEVCDPSTWRDKALSLRANYFEAHGLFLNNNKTRKKKKKNPVAAQATVTNCSNHGKYGSDGDRGNNDITSPFEIPERLSNLMELVDRKYGPSPAEDDNRAASLDREEEQDMEVMKAPRKRKFMKKSDYLNAHRGYTFDVQKPSEKCEQVSKLKELMDRWSKLEEAQSQLNLDRVHLIQEHTQLIASWS